MRQSPQRFSALCLLILLSLTCLAQDGRAQGVRLSAGPAFDLGSDLHKHSGLLLGADYYWFVDYGWLWGASFQYIGFDLDPETAAGSFQELGPVPQSGISGGGWSMISLMTTTRLRFNVDMEALAFYLNVGLGPSMMIAGDITAVKGTKEQTLNGARSVAVTALFANGVELPIATERIALTAQFGGMVNFFIDEEKNDRIPAFFLSFGLEYRIVP